MNDRKFIPAYARDSIYLSHAEPKASSDLFQELVADGMPERVVDVLELVEIEIEESHLLAASSAGKRVLQTVAQQYTIGQFRECIV